MAVFPNFKLTNNGVNLLNRVIAEKKVLKFTKLEIGEGDYRGDIKTLSQLVNKIKDFPVTETNVLSGGETNIKGYFDNSGVNNDKKLKEIGVFAQLGDEQLTEVLFSYTNCGDTADTIPAQSKNFFSRTLSVVNKTSDAKDITFSVKLEYKKMDFNTVAELKLANWLSNGDKINLWGDETLGDVKKTSKIIVTENTGIKLNNGLYAKDYTSFVQDGGYNGTGQDLKKCIDNLDNAKQNKIDSGLLTTNKIVVKAINEVMPWKSNQIFSEHFFHKLWGGSKVYCHAYPPNYTTTEGCEQTQYIIRTAKNNSVYSYEYELGGGDMFVDGKQFLNQNNIGSSTLLFSNTTQILQHRTITLSESWDNFEKIVIVGGNIIAPNIVVDMFNNVFYTSTIIVNNDATANNNNGEYCVNGMMDYLIDSLYFRNDRRNIYVGASRYTGSGSSLFSIVKIFGVNRKNGGRL